MSTTTTSGQETFEVAQCSDDQHTNVANLSYGADEAKEHTYTVTLDENGAVECTCPHFTYRVAYCKHMAAVDQATIEDEKEISGPYTGYDCYGSIDHTYWRCEDCGAEATDKRALEDCC